MELSNTMKTINFLLKALDFIVIGVLNLLWLIPVRIIVRSFCFLYDIGAFSLKAFVAYGIFAFVFAINTGMIK